jgi:hypothetical protein
MDNVNNPPHYTKDKSIETWDAILFRLGKGGILMEV